MNPELLELAKRATEALERLAQDPVFQMETMPPVCPHCEEMNPVVSVNDQAGQGLLAEFVIRATCLKCNSEFFMLPLQSECVKTASEMAEVINERNIQRGFNSGQGQGTPS